MFNVITGLARKTRDDLLSEDSNPEHVRSFSGHLSGCSRSHPLWIEKKHEMTLTGPWITGMLAEFKLVEIVTTCSECRGSVTTKV